MTVGAVLKLVRSIDGVAELRQTDDSVDIDLGRGTCVGAARFRIDGYHASVGIRRAPDQLIVMVQSFEPAEVDRKPCRERLDRICEALDSNGWITGAWEYDDSWEGREQWRSFMSAILLVALGGVVALVAFGLRRRRDRSAA